MKATGIGLGAILSLVAFGTHAEPARERACFSATETREKILAHGLSEPFRLMRSAAGRLQAEALSAKLCRWGTDLVYEINLLRRDGRLIHVFLNATNGQAVGERETK